MLSHDLCFDSLTAKIDSISARSESLSVRGEESLTANATTSLPVLSCSLGIGDLLTEAIQMYDTSPLTPFKGETKPNFLHVELDTKTLESLFDLHPSLENSFDLSELVSCEPPSSGIVVGRGGGGAVDGGVAGVGGTVVGGVVGSSQAPLSPPSPHHPPSGGRGIPPIDSAVVTSAVASSADLLTLSSAATSQHLAEIERQAGARVTTTTTSASSLPHHVIGPLFGPLRTSPVPVVPSTPSPVSHLHHTFPTRHSQQQHHHSNHHNSHHHHHHQQQQQYAPALSPSLTVDDVSQALSDDSCVFMPEYDQPAGASSSAASASSSSTSTTAQANGGGQMVGLGRGGSGAWGQAEAGFGGYATVKTEDLGLSSLTACSLEASLPGFTASAIVSSSSPSPTASSPMVACKMEYEAGPSSHYALSPSSSCSTSPRTSIRTLSESSTATTATMPDSPRRGSGSGLPKAGSKRRMVPKGSFEYKEKRARNNVAVRKSRAKAKEKQRSTEGRVKELTDMNDTLTKKVEMLTKELTVLRGLFVNVGASLPDDFASILEQS